MKKSQNRNISLIWGDALAEQIEMKICTGVELRDIIMNVKFKQKKISDVDVIGGQNSPFPIDFARGP